LKNQLVITVSGADEGLERLRVELGTHRTHGTLGLRRLRNEGSTASLELAIASELASYLTTSVELERTLQGESGLAEAIQRSRLEGILAALPMQLDETLYRLRNALVHLPAGDELRSPIPIPGGDSIVSLSVLRHDERFTARLAHTIVNLINTLYASDFG
jgi:hypothetical protein